MLKTSHIQFQGSNNGLLLYHELLIVTYVVQKAAVCLRLVQSSIGDMQFVKIRLK